MSFCQKLPGFLRSCCLQRRAPARPAKLWRREKLADFLLTDWGESSCGLMLILQVICENEERPYHSLPFKIYTDAPNHSVGCINPGDWRSGTCGCICQWGFSAGGALLTGNCGPMYEQFECLSIMCDCLLTQLLQIIDPYLVSERCLLIMTPQDIMVTV